MSSYVFSAPSDTSKSTIFSRMLKKEGGVKYSFLITVHTAGNLALKGIEDHETAFCCFKRGSKRYFTENCIVEGGIAVWNRSIQITTTLYQDSNVNNVQYLRKVFRVQINTQNSSSQRKRSIFGKQNGSKFEAEIDLSKFVHSDGTENIELLSLHLNNKIAEKDTQDPIRLQLTLRSTFATNEDFLESPSQSPDRVVLNNAVDSYIDTPKSFGKRTFNTICRDALETELSKLNNELSRMEFEIGSSGRFRSFSMDVPHEKTKHTVRIDSKEESPMDWCLNRNHLERRVRAQKSNTKSLQYRHSSGNNGGS